MFFGTDHTLLLMALKEEACWQSLCHESINSQNFLWFATKVTFWGRRQETNRLQAERIRWWLKVIARLVWIFLPNFSIGLKNGRKCCNRNNQSEQRSDLRSQSVACGQAHLWVTRASGEEQSDPAEKSLVTRKRRPENKASPLDSLRRELVLQRKPTRRLQLITGPSSTCSSLLRTTDQDGKLGARNPGPWNVIILK